MADDKVHTSPRKDYITRLTDDILCHIISYLDMEDAIRTSVLSRRWRKLYYTLPNPKFECLKMFKSVTLTGHNNLHYDYEQIFLTSVDRFLRLCSGLPMESFTLRFGLMWKFPEHLRRWLNCIIRFGVRKLELSFCCNDKLPKVPNSELIVFPFKVLLSATMLEYVKLSYCILEPNFLGPSSSLKELTLCFVPLVNGEVESILSSCPQLRLLVLNFCELPYKLLVKALELRTMKIIFCEQVREIGLFAPNLDFFDYYGNCGLSFLPSYVPNLRRLNLDFKNHEGPPDGVAGFVRGAPCLNALWIQAFPYQFQHIKTEMPTLWNLDTLALHVIQGSLDLRDIMSLIAVCPNLSKFQLSTPLCLLRYTERDAEVLPSCAHLKLVVLDGFKFGDAQKKFTSQLIRCAPALEEMKIYIAYFLYRLGEKVEETLPLERRVFPQELINETKQQLKQQASSPSVVVNISSGN